MKAVFNKVAQGYLSKFEVNVQGLHLVVRFFYGMTTIVFYAPHLKVLFHNWDMVMADFENRSVRLWPVQWVNLVSESSFILLVLLLGGFLCSVMVTLFPHKKWLRVLVFLLNFLNLALKYSPTKIDHDFHAILLTSFWMIFMNLNKIGAQSNRNKLYFWAVQMSFLGTYFLAGLWKLRKFISYVIEMEWKEIPRCLVSHFAFEYITNSLRNPFFTGVLEFLKEPSINHLLWVGVILFQILAPIASWFPPIQRFYGVLIILFHISTWMLMDLRFAPYQWVALIILVCHPYQRRK